MDVDVDFLLFHGSVQAALQLFFRALFTSVAYLTRRDMRFEGASCADRRTSFPQPKARASLSKFDSRHADQCLVGRLKLLAKSSC